MYPVREIFLREYRRVVVKTTDGSLLTGKVNLGVKDRLSELFTRTPNPFIVMVDVEERGGEGKVLFINKSQIVWVEPQDFPPAGIETEDS